MDSGSPAPPPQAIPDRLHDAPTANGLVIPYITLCHHGRTSPVWGDTDPHRMVDAFKRRLCQLCGHPLTEQFLVFIRPQDFLLGIAHEPGLHLDCGEYAKSACPMLAAAVHRYRPRPPDHRITPCADPDCQCRSWPPVAPSARQGHPADAWYAAVINLVDYRIIHRPATDTHPAFAGIAVGDGRIRSLSKIRDAAGPAAGKRNELDQLGVLLAFTRLVGDP